MITLKTLTLGSLLSLALALGGCSMETSDGQGQDTTAADPASGGGGAGSGSTGSVGSVSQPLDETPGSRRQSRSVGDDNSEPNPSPWTEGQPPTEPNPSPWTGGAGNGGSQNPHHAPPSAISKNVPH